MAKGIFVQSGTITTNADTPLTVTPGAGERIYILQIKFSVSVAGTTTRLAITDGVGGPVIARAATTSADTFIDIYCANGDEGLPLAPVVPPAVGNAVNANTSGGAAATLNYYIMYQVR